MRQARIPALCFAGEIGLITQPYELCCFPGSTWLLELEPLVTALILGALPGVLNSVFSVSHGSHLSGESGSQDYRVKIFSLDFWED